ncbi:lantibiotic dehydratase C-terminal domain-containing protein [Ornithinibacillus halotolerans]|uniref:Thiopeptide-type bacteriocin biosynthesis domain-containing protein n=1 Tax=Ornithinibacillus halotolerans TaxID=1274357 RepID=A0A916RR59_9BACI|nr:lantibiotic dehydratase C-terminal domain-containing protein [Ornithinibacillus halotolerans]GGA66210.1 hypothetical protein GCM10008025_07560 [Ornithinibacillus halotolerans]
MEPNNNWGVLKIYYYDKNKYPLLIDGVFPIMKEFKLENSINNFYFEPHWEHGPHIRLFVEVSTKRLKEDIVGLVKKKLDTYLMANPSRGNLDEELYKQIHSSLAWWELSTVEEMDLQPNNSVIVSSEQPSTMLWGGELGVKMVQKYLSKNNEFLFTCLKQIRDNEIEKFGVVLKLMYIHAWLMDPSLKYSHLSFRSHAEAFFMSTEEPSKYRKLFQDKFLKQKNTSQVIIQTIEEEINSGLVPDLFQKFINVYEEIYHEVLSYIKNGEISSLSNDKMNELSEEIRKEKGLDWVEIASSNEFHSTLLSNNWKNFMDNNIEFMANRFMINLLYTVFVQIGITPLERYLLCWYFSQVIEENYQIDSIALVKNLQKLL